VGRLGEIHAASQGVIVTAGAVPTGRRGESGRLRWIAVLFIVGSVLFGLGALPFYSQVVGLRVCALTFFVGSLFFTGAAFLQYREAGATLPTGSHRHPLAVWAPRNLGWLACVIQLAGTLWFNWSTGNALRSNLNAALADQRVWRPDAFGSIAFLIASGLALADASRSADPRRPRPRIWKIGVANMVGSVAFGVSAIASYVVPASGDVWNAELSNLGTFAGAVCFLIGAILLLPRRAALAADRGA
jgi:hypothetical protein